MEQITTQKNLDYFTFLQNKMFLGFFVVGFHFNGTVSVYDSIGNSFAGHASCAGVGPCLVTKDFNEALEFVRKHSVFIWTNNDKKHLVEEYNITRGFVESFLRYTWPTNMGGVAS